MIDCAVEEILFKEVSSTSSLLSVEIKISTDFKKLNVLLAGLVMVSFNSSRVTSFIRFPVVLKFLRRNGSYS